MSRKTQRRVGYLIEAIIILFILSIMKPIFHVAHDVICRLVDYFGG